MQHGITITRNDNGEIVGWLQGATFGENDCPHSHAMKSYIFTWDYVENNPYGDDGERTFEKISVHAIDDETAFAIFDHHYNVSRCLNLEFNEKIVTFRNIPIPVLA